MAKQILNIGSSANDGSGTTLRAGGDLINDNFNEIYTTFGDGTNLTSSSIPHKIGGTNFTDSLLVGHATTGTLNAAIRNVGIGVNTLDALTSGDNNIAIGFVAGTNINSGSSNIAIGSGALTTSTGASNNVAIGMNTLQSADSSTTENTSIGNQSGLSVSSGNVNTFLGFQAGSNINSGSGNVIIGSVAADSATGDRQLKIAGHDGTTTTTWLSGDSAGLLTITGGEIIPGKNQGTNFTNSLLVGHATTGTLSSAERNTGVGVDSLDALTSGDANTALGYRAGSGMTAQGESVYVGVDAGKQTQGGNNTVVGAYAFQGSNNANSYENTAVGSRALFTAGGSTASLRNVAVGRDAGYGITSGDYNVVLGYDSGDNITTGSGNVTIGTVDVATATGDRQLKIAGFDGSTTTTWISGDSAGALTFANNINVGGNATITGNLTVNGTTTTVNSTEVTIQNAFVFEGATADAHETTLTVVDPTADRTLTLPNESGDVIIGKFQGSGFTRSLLVGHSTTGTLSADAVNNVGVGSSALEDITTGDDNTVIGYRAGRDINSAGANTALGSNALQTVTGNSGNTAIGRSALTLTTGTNNIGLGLGAGDNITSGSGNVILGNVDAGSATGDRQLKIAGYDGSTTTTWISGDSSGVVTATLAANTITSTQLASATTLLILDSSGSTLKTIIGAGS